MKVCYPIRNTNGQEFRQQDEVIRLITGEAHGTWLLGTNGLWHGGIHISDISAPFSAFNPDAVNTGEPVPLQFMTDGTLVAYRVNDTYPSAPYCGRPLRYSSTFALVKSVCKPDPDKEATWLEFYSLYMHLAPVADYPLSPCYKVNDGHNNITLRQFTRGQYGVPEGDESGSACAAPHPIAKKLKSGDRVVVSRTGRFYVTQHHQSVLMTFGLARLVGGNKPGDEQFWVTLDPELLVPDGELAELMPEWMHLAQEKGTFNEVVVTDGSDCWKVSAGAPLGFLGCMESPGTGAIIAEKEWYAHLEVLSVDPGMPNFLANSQLVTSGKHYVIAQKGKALSIRCGETGNYTFKEGIAKLGQQVIISRDEANPTQDPSGKWWFNIMGGGWLSQEDISEAGQYDLMKLGFMPLEENSAGDQTDTPFESWVPEVFGQVSRAAEQGHSNQYSLVPQFYRDVLDKMGQDGKISGEEIRQALTIRDPLVRDVVSRMVVKHHSEWFGGRSTGRWDGFYKMLGPLEAGYCEKWQADLEWMSKVPPFNQDSAIWHMHPVVFLDAISDISLPKTPVNGELVPLDFVDFYNGDIIDESDYELAAKKLKCEVAAIKAVARTETGSSGSYFKFQGNDDYVPAILFERHHFHKYTSGKYDSQTDISNKNAGGYGKNSDQYPKLIRAYALDKRSALMATSWGKFQILASNYKAAGYSSPEEFVKSLSESENNQLSAFVNFINSDSVLLQAIRNKDWLGFAERYNGPRQNGYDSRMRSNYEQSK